MKIEQLEILDIFDQIKSQNLHLQWLAQKKFTSHLSRMLELCSEAHETQYIKQYLQIKESQLAKLDLNKLMPVDFFIECVYEINQKDDLRLWFNFDVKKTFDLQISTDKITYPIRQKGFSLHLVFEDKDESSVYFYVENSLMKNVCEFDNDLATFQAELGKHK